MTKTYSGTELVARPHRLALMNLYLHGIHADIALGDSIYEPLKNTRYTCVLTNPPFGTKGANQAPARDDFTVATSNKQLNFIQHVVNILKPGGRAAIVLPDGVLSGNEVIKLLTEDANLHTILRLPIGTFTPYSPGVKANVFFFTKGMKTENIWIYDCRTNIPKVTKKERPLTAKHFEDFEKCYGKDPNGTSLRQESERFKVFHISEIIKRNYDLDIFWLKDKSFEEEFEPPEVIINSISNAEKTIHNMIKQTINLLDSNDFDTESWETKELKDVVEIIMGQSPPSKTYNRNREGLPFYQGKKDFGALYSKTSNWCTEPIKIAEKEDVLLSVRAPVGPVNMAKEKCCIGRGSTFNAIKKDDIKKIEISYPKSKSEQKELVSKIKVILDYNKEMITQNTNISSNLLRFQKSVLSRIFKQE